MIRLETATEAHALILKRLQQLYLHDLSAYSTLEMAEGLYINDDVDEYLSNPDLYPFMIMLNDQAIGFILFNQQPFAPQDHDYFINDFFIIKQYRRKGYGIEAFKVLLKQYFGAIGILALKENRPAVQFWRMALKDRRPDEIEMVVDEEVSFLISFLNE